MAKILKKHLDIVTVIGIGLFLTIAGIIGMYGLTPSSVNTVEAATTATVAVTATVQEWMSITASPASVTLTPDLVDTSGNTAIASSSDITLTAKTNSADGYTITVTGDNNGLISGGNTIDSVADGATTTIAAGTDGYGLNATSTESTIDTYYDNWGTDTLGSIRTGGQSMADYTGPTDVDGHVTTIKIEAACDENQPNGSYTDTVTLTITAVP